MSIELDRKQYDAEGELSRVHHNVYNHLVLYRELEQYQKILGFIQDVVELKQVYVDADPATSARLGGYIRDKIDGMNQRRDPTLWPKFGFSFEADYKRDDDDLICLCARPDSATYYWRAVGLFIHVSPKIKEWFDGEYGRYITGRAFEYDNLLHLTMIVKNAGSEFGGILESYIPFIDRWTILDTGSTDGTQDVIKQVLGAAKRGRLYEEPFVDFGTSRNRCLELAGHSTVFIIMLDDTYTIKGDLRGFLQTVRSDQYSDSFTLFIESRDISYGSNRIIKSYTNLRYNFKIHEVFEDRGNVSVIVPKEDVTLVDNMTEYMNVRTAERKQLDYQLLQDGINHDPEEPRYLYYMARTYSMEGNDQEAYAYNLRRVFHSKPGYIHEKVDACFEAARVAQYKLGKSWLECEFLYRKTIELDPRRPEPHYFIGVHYYLVAEYQEAFVHFRRAFDLGYPEYAQYSLKPTLSYYYLPKFLIELCHKFKEWDLGAKVAAESFEKYAQPPDDVNIKDQFRDWIKLFGIAALLPSCNAAPTCPKRPIFCILADGNWREWSGDSLYSEGLGGSETFVAEMAKYICKLGQFEVHVFCKTDSSQVCDGVHYRPIEEWLLFIRKNVIHTCLISRFTEYLLAAIESNIERIFLIAHDISFSTTVLLRHPKIQKIFGLTNFHCNLLKRTYPELDFVPFGYGVEAALTCARKKLTDNIVFIYSSTANRGLLHLLEMWPKISHKYGGRARLEIYSDLNLKWVNDVYPQMNEIRALVSTLEGVEVKGWVDKMELYRAWLRANVWLYPCIFIETFCLTALEAMASRTLILTNDLGSLPEVIGDAGICVAGDPQTSEWQERALDALFKNIDNQTFIKNGYQKATNLTWKARAKGFTSMYLPVNILEYRDMYNWTNDIPSGSLNQFKKILSWLPPDPKVLEVGTYTGTSIIGMLLERPDARAHVIDAWKDYMEMGNIRYSSQIFGSFLSNIKKSGVSNRITYSIGTSFDELAKLIRFKQEYDLVYVDGSHHHLDCFADMVLAWRLVKEGGYLLVDDYTFTKEITAAIDHFTLQAGVTVVFKDGRILLSKNKK